ncbi:ABC transporter ATP-binding protein [Variovorax sp. NFACC27]|uniref:ABC transporter ATP-binding protein n=1 Tax=unclassified Variovorax TaxID=663243 RepID=UPI00089993DF|nr:branched-chain amino acid transport system ATP-binding protein [Variovorax sp. NFACC28]SEG98167.1 branched-chain amino acid transport system ATP-binding protein [Variovorax sp. NFACC29]SFE05202.1 branched-chain amino acid transport system ATP-binding protein [Variovorax sp. NFACC26]SFH13131.1 branched-chain amino acid transport system ATP-binding protein [Variovorax sp. NFACC27]
MLEVKALSAHYGKHRALADVAINVEAGQVVSVLGANGAGKSTLLRCIAGLMPTDGASLVLNGKPLGGLKADQRVEAGIALVPEGRGIFGDLTVRENISLGAYPRRARAGEQRNLARVLELFPRLRERMTQSVRTMSGGEQQMVAIGRALMSSPDVLLLDEPSLGLSPLMVSELFKSLERVRDDKVSILLVEQNARRSLALSSRGYLLEQGRIVGEDDAQRLLASETVQRAYLGG